MILFCFQLAWSQNPHGDSFKVDCAACHNPNGWNIAMDTFSFDHSQTKFPLHGTHQQIDCKLCHVDLVFSNTKMDCASCHADVHQNSVGFDCIRCHNENDWLVFEIPQIHESNGFPLTGAHQVLLCAECHKQDNPLRFDPIGNDCLSCHQEDYDRAENPNHIEGMFSTNCIECHNPDFGGWGTENINHSFFPLTLGHDIQDCKKCHLTENFADADPNCISCHLQDFESSTAPNHQNSGISMDCIQCHTTDPGWRPAEFRDHDNLHFPIYSGEHQGEWNACIDCHTDPNNFAIFTCIGCHLNPETDNEHQGVGGYIYEDNACLACHPTGDGEMPFDHNTTSFALTGAHLAVECLACHANGFPGTPTACEACHQVDFDATINPNHPSLGLSNDCAACHTTDPDWKPAQFDVHDDYYMLNGAHALIANDCAACHNGDYNNTPNTCVGCHQNDFDETTNPNHQASGFDTDCASCHSEASWTPSTFDHDGQYFPIYSGKHEGEWNACVDCHTDPNNFAIFTCIGCHLNPETDNEHQGVGGYIYEDNACLACHPTGDGEMPFDHNTTSFALTGAHLAVECLACHTNGFPGTPTACEACHQVDFDATINPNHPSLGLSNDCVACHTTDPDWKPAQFDVHDDYYTLNGAHALIANDCAACHNGDYNNTPNTCVGCHQDDFEETTNPNHQASGFDTDCASCHSEASWTPSTFDHDGQYFPIYSGKHEGEWNACVDCHTDPNNFAIFTCIGCHLNPETDNEHQGVGGYIYEDNACLACHPTGDGEMPFDHNTTSFALTGAHLAVECLACHANGFPGTPTACEACHQVDFDATINPNHQSLGLSNDCVACHTTDPDWKPAQFDVHDDYYMLNGAHALIANDCVACHNGDYNNTPNTCVGCHQNDFDETTNPNHQASGFDTDCASCHSEASWTPSTFDHDGQYFPIYSGKHEGEWAACIDCHTDQNNFAIFTCIGCHLNPETDNEHQGVGGYIYEDNACLACHPTGDGEMPFDHNATSFALTGAHLGLDCITCHANGFQGTPTACEACHQVDFDGTINPNHPNLGLSNDCATCHTTDAGWMPASFDVHDNYYPLTGAHASIANDCAACHNGNYVNTPNTCAGCHQDDFDGTTNPNHPSLGLSNDCASCHTTDAGWIPASFDVHDNYYPLTGAHASIANDCAACHNGNYVNTPNTCAGCHQDDFDGTTNPNHPSLGLSNDCASCHTTDAGWIPASFDVHDNYYPLTGAHASIANDCAACHNGNYVNTPNTCAGCHQDDFDGTTNPNHPSLGLSNDCASCHTTDAGWMPASFDVHDNYYPLTGAHASIANDCATCHNGNYVNTPNTCAGCHQDDYDGTTNPNHQQANFVNACANCHDETAWVPSSYSHDFYPLNGAHASLDCNSCHSTAYSGTPTTCIACHQDDYDNTTNPNHAAAMFPTDCLSCHNESAWTPSTFDHDNMYFPIYSGKHENEWNACIDCHIVANDYTIFSCIDCHEHDNQSEVDDDHDGVSGYIYESNACFACHPTGED